MRQSRKSRTYILPTYRYEQQLYDLYASPQSITNSRNKEYVLAEILSSLAVKLGAKAVLIDLRAGISEYSAPLLLDPRVKNTVLLQHLVNLYLVLKNSEFYIKRS